MYNIVKRNRVKVRSVDYIGYDLLSINFTRNTVKRKNGIDEYPYAPLLTYSTRQRAVYLRVTCRIIMNPRNCINYPGLLTRYRFNRGKKPIDRFMYSIYEPNRVFNHCDRFAKCCLFNSCNNLFPIHRMPAPRRISIDRKEIFNQKEKSYLRSKYSGDDLIAALSGNEQTLKRRSTPSLSKQKEHRSSSQIVDSLIIVHCYPAKIFWTRFSFTGFVHARLTLVKRTVIFHRVRGKYIQWAIRSNVGNGWKGNSSTFHSKYYRKTRFSKANSDNVLKLT